MIDALRSEDEWTRAKAAMTLGKVGDARALVPLLEAMRDANMPMRVKMAGALQNIDSNWPRNSMVEHYVPRLLADLKSDESKKRALAVMVLGRMNRPTLSQQLLPMLGDSSLSVRKAAIEAIANCDVADFPRLAEFIAADPDVGAGTALAASVVVLDRSSVGTIIVGFVRAVHFAIPRLSLGWVLMLAVFALLSVVLMPARQLRYSQGMALGMLGVFAGPVAMVIYVVAVKTPFVQNWTALGRMFAVCGIAMLWGVALVVFPFLLYKSREEFFAEDTGAAMRVLHFLTVWVVRLTFVLSGGILLSLLLYGAIVSRAAAILVAVPEVVALVLVGVTVVLEWWRSRY